MSNTENLLLEVMDLHRQKQQHLKTIARTTHRMLGRKQIAITDEERSSARSKAIAHYNQRIDALYDRINQQLPKPLKNPFAGKEEEHHD